MNHKKLLKLPLLLLCMSTFTFATLYNNGNKDDKHELWRIYDNKPSGAEINTDHTDNALYLSSYATFKGKGRSNAYMLGAKSQKSELSWNNTKEFVCSWYMQIEEKYRITIYTTTEKGSRRFVFTHKKRDRGLYRKKYIGIGLGKKSISKEWKHIEMDLADTLDKYEPDNKLISINGIQVRGSGNFDSIELKSHLGYVDKVKKYCEDKVYNNNRMYCDEENQIAYYTTFSSSPKFGYYLYSINMQSGKTLEESFLKERPTGIPNIKNYTDIPLISVYDGDITFYNTQPNGKFTKIQMLKLPLFTYINSMETIENNTKLAIHYNQKSGNSSKEYVTTYDISSLPTMTLLSTEEE